MTSEEYVTNAINDQEETLEKGGLEPLNVFGNKYRDRTFLVS